LTPGAGCDTVPAVKNSVPKNPAYPIESVDNALKLLHLLRDRSHVRVSEASSSIGVARSTAHRLLAMLRHHGFVRQDPFSRAYVAGPALLDVGLASLRDRDIRSQARPFLEALSRETGETVHLITLQGRDVLFLDCVESARAVRVGNRTGLVLPAHCTSAGKALLAALPPERFKALYPKEGLHGLTRRSIRTRARLERELSLVRKRRYATNFGETEEDIGSVGVLIQDRRRIARAALSVAAPTSRLTDKTISTVAKAALRRAAAIGETLP
jgi:IclR family transcriptional regulator, acetate operon repressor